MNGKSCAMCKHWRAPNKEDEWNAVRKLFGTCRAAPMFDAACDWDKETLQDVLKPEYAATTMLAEDGSAYFAAVLTKAEHWCSMFAEQNKSKT